MIQRHPLGKREIEVLPDPRVQEHLNRNPRVLGYRGEDVWTVDIDINVPVQMGIASEAKALGLLDLGRRPHS